MFARTRRRPTVAVLVAAAAAIASLAALSGCAAAAPPAPTETSTPAPTPTATALPAMTTLESVIGAQREHPVLTVTGPAEPLAGEQAQQVTYPSGGITVAGVLRTPPGLSGPAPVAIVIHGAVNPERYESGHDRPSEQRALLAAGFLVLAVDLRGFGASDPANVADSLTVDPGFGWPVVLDWGMALDVANAMRLAADGQLPGPIRRASPSSGTRSAGSSRSTARSSSPTSRASSSR
ncbi:hypothetical protein [Agromyces protaetiae]|uniref:hypothetical protein n=1 Tax=Agromyces protaetiae TaxID=2509455 RepID=UPI001FB59529|nr:hypothetical protein [Agromyces protaetiae]